MNGDAIGFDRDWEASPTIKVEIYDQAYTVRSDGDPEYLKQLAEYVDQRMREISSGTLTVDSRKVAILAALYIATSFINCGKRTSRTTNSWRPQRRMLRCSTGY
jgi:cell division protein ZapA